MEDTQVIFVGGGPSGLALGLALAQHNVQSVILERETDSVTDPRGVWLTGDAIRISHGLGLGPDMDSIGQEACHANFHQSTFSSAPFYQIPFEGSDKLEQALPEGFQMSQPKLEDAFRRRIAETTCCDLRTGCTVVGRLSEVPPIVEYTDAEGSTKSIRGKFLVGADGKTGIVRKRFLEPTAGIHQQAGIYPYEGVWIASNLRMTLPTPETHPDFSLWKLGYEPQEVYDLFWPVGWHFCAPPGKPTATGRFGPVTDRTWRHEFRVDNEASGPIYSEELLWEHLVPNITLEKDAARSRDFGGRVQYPLDCIKILRCRPFKFVHKCVNRWFDKRTMLIGDAAHVFPPFAGQGVASGLRDAHQLAWRLALLLLDENSIDKRMGLLEIWALERRQSVDDAARLSKVSGFVCNNQPTWWVLLLANVLKILSSTPWLGCWSDLIAVHERKGFSGVPGGFHLGAAYNGGARLAQIHLQSSHHAHDTFLSDKLLKSHGTIFTLLVISDTGEKQRAWLRDEAEAAFGSVSFAPEVLSARSIIVYATTPTRHDGEIEGSAEYFSPALVSDNNVTVPTEYNGMAYVNRLGRSTRFAIIRPDWFVFACARNQEELLHCLVKLKQALLD